MKVMLAVLTIVLAGPSCAKPGPAIDLAAKFAKEEAAITVTNNTGQSLRYSPVLLTFPKLASGDFHLDVSEGGRRVKVCGVMDHHGPVDSLVVAPGSKVTFLEDIERLSAVHCLRTGKTYELRVVYAKLDAAARKDVLFSSPPTRFAAINRSTQSIPVRFE